MRISLVSSFEFLWPAVYIQVAIQSTIMWFLIWIWIFLGIHHSPLDGTNLQIESSKEQNQGKD